MNGLVSVIIDNIHKNYPKSGVSDRYEADIKMLNAIAQNAEAIIKLDSYVKERDVKNIN